MFISHAARLSRTLRLVPILAGIIAAAGLLEARAQGSIFHVATTASATLPVGGTRAYLPVIVKP